MTFDLWLPFILLAFLLFKPSRWGSRDAHWPPGPSTMPLVGIILQFPKAFLQLRFTEWAHIYDDIISVRP